ncbi:MULTISPECIES: SagB/ThcOx family dehydrogenase [unclassified Streptomyces]|uniref:SagB/ThcOx family dehydrogenase n=1 Tax=Streptomyces TaxID=1883 RepID=UPI00136EF6C4|nr:MULTISPECIES: SagB/ThcOx family dehydrogenase [unclassified Streptomyces]NEA03431.1 SagB/ThcOx family dehydrogenase [Streptomyces sp. SID10116]MYY83916.1 SagB/ThcOx family dehydrogenase [Streptomyces sp. SID335]MYZ13601.1 SagB/ThcOx family dehydrogenase [Streptomyces sp. SID337]NDZ84118.1 SagB/ThcOx family dehydrogenase [Streptomyces sp. SID10115]NEB44673.1 SagB/ThcOx family dehydrogenase [Streptomyces sp. SID339]
MRLRRSRCLTCYWHEGLFVVHPYLRGTPTALHPAVSEILAAFEDWTSEGDAASTLGHLTPDTVKEAVDALTEAGILLAEGSPDAVRDEETERQWGAWSPEAPFFHYATQGVYDDPPVETEGEAAHAPPDPALFTEYAQAPRVLLPRWPHASGLDAPYTQVLYRRRTHRDFSREPVALETLGVLLASCFGPVDFIDSGRAALYRRTSPQGGARQEIDTYLGVLNVTGAAPGWYHYNGLQHSLELLTEGFTREEAAVLCADQDWAGDAAFLVVLAARLERMSVKYPTPRCYRVCLLNAGHLGQTFALTATALGLGPAQTGAFRDAALAERCTLDNAGHTPLYVLAAGHPHHAPKDCPPLATADTFATTRLAGPAGCAHAAVPGHSHRLPFL